MFALAALVLAATAVFQAKAKVPANCDRSATVAAGDTCDIISAQYNVSTYQLANANNGTIDQDCNNLYVGEPLCLGIKGQDCNTTHVVEAGNTCNGIAGTYNISESTLSTNNPNVNGTCTNLYPGEVLCVSNKTYVYSTQSS